jgi:hypothetical protein
MYALRRKDPELHRKWKIHLRKSQNHLQNIYQNWQQLGYLHKNLTQEDIKTLIDLYISCTNSFLQFYESRQRRSPKSSVIKGGVDFIMKVMQPHLP